MRECIGSRGRSTDVHNPWVLRGLFCLRGGRTVPRPRDGCVAPLRAKVFTQRTLRVESSHGRGHATMLISPTRSLTANHLPEYPHFPSTLSRRGQGTLSSTTLSKAFTSDPSFAQRRIPRFVLPHWRSADSLYLLVTLRAGAPRLKLLRYDSRSSPKSHCHLHEYPRHQTVY